MSENLINSCSICLKYMEENDFGNNPYPFFNHNARCCDDCNTMFVIPARIMRIKNQKKTTIK